MERARRSRRYNVGLLIAAGAIIAIGVAVRPKENPADNRVSEIETARLQRLAQERRLTELGDFIAYAAQNAAKALLYLPDLEQTAVVMDRTTAAAGSLRATATAVEARPRFGAPLNLTVQSRRPDVPVTFLRSSGPMQAPPRAAVDTGDWVLAVALRTGGAPMFAYGLFENAVESRCGALTYTRYRSTVPLTDALVGGGLFTLRGGLIGVIARCDSEVVVLSTSSLAAALSRPAPPNELLQDRYGLRVADDDGPGVRVAAVWKASPADRLGVQPGDRIVRIDTTEAETGADLAAALGSEGPHTISLRRGRRALTVRMSVEAAPRPVEARAAGMVLGDSDTGVAVRSILEGGPAARAGLLPGDMIHRVSGRNADSALSVAAALGTGKPVTLTVGRRDSEFEVELAP